MSLKLNVQNLARDMPASGRDRGAGQLDNWQLRSKLVAEHLRKVQPAPDFDIITYMYFVVNTRLVSCIFTSDEHEDQYSKTLALYRPSNLDTLVWYCIVPNKSETHIIRYCMRQVTKCDAVVHVASVCSSQPYSKASSTFHGFKLVHALKIVAAA